MLPQENFEVYPFFLRLFLVAFQNKSYVTMMLRLIAISRHTYEYIGVKKQINIPEILPMVLIW